VPTAELGAEVCARLAVAVRRLGGQATVRPGAPQPGYGVAGPVPVATVEPQDEAAVAAAVAAAREHGWALVPRGAGTRDGWGGPIAARPTVVLATTSLRGVVAYEPGDLTIRIRSGTPLAELERTLQAHTQFLALEPPHADRATVGGTVCADAWGPTRLAHGGARDLVLGLRAVDGAGRAFAAGGNVVKNVSGLDIGKLLVGSFGSLAVLTEVCLKLRPRPSRRTVWAAAFPVPAAAWALARKLLAGQFQPAGLTLSEGPRGAVLCVCLEGGQAEVEDQQKRLDASMGGGTALDPEQAALAWRSHRDVEPRGAADLAVRCEVPEGQLEGLVRAVAEWPVSVRRVAWPGTGTLWAILEAGVVGGLRPAELLAFVRELRRAAEERGGRAVVVGGPPEVRAEVQPFGEPGPLEPWFRALKRRFDPDGVLAPGRFVAGL
jgi:glycolate oxidase FAD binding subunit